MGPEDPIASVPSPKRNPASTPMWSRPVILEMIMMGGEPARRALVYEIMKELTRAGKTNRRIHDSRVAGWYIVGKALNILDPKEDPGNVSMDKLLKEVDLLNKKIETGSDKQTEKPKFSEGSIDDLRML